MILYPALDILDGRVVRLVQGDFEQRTDALRDQAIAVRAGDRL